MADTFKVLASGYVKPFNQQKLTNEQRHARQVLQTHLDDIMQVNSRGMYLHELTVCVAGFAEEDENEEIDVTHFSEYNYFKVFSQDLVSYSDKFDFLLLCVRHWICQVHAAFVERFLRLIDGVLTPFNDENPIQTVLDLVVLTTPRVAAEADMETRDKWLYDFVHKENWPLYQQELARLEAEQEVFEREQRQAAYKSLFGWECTESPLPYSDRMRGLRLAPGRRRRRCCWRSSTTSSTLPWAPCSAISRTAPTLRRRLRWRRPCSTGSSWTTRWSGPWSCPRLPARAHTMGTSWTASPAPKHRQRCWRSTIWTRTRS
jgi:hypothetical protein